ncbi:MAG: hypothetical protein AAFQ92_26045, partial [Bacteroidota bacterium]
MDQLMTQRGLDRWGGISSERQSSIWLVFIMLFVSQLLWLRRFTVTPNANITIPTPTLQARMVRSSLM